MPPLPALELVPLSSGGDPLARAPLGEDGSWTLPPELAARGVAALLGPALPPGTPVATAEGARRVSRLYRASTLARAQEKGGLRVPAGTWRRWVPRSRTMTGQLRRVRLGAWWYRALGEFARPEAEEARGRGGGRWVPFADLEGLLAWSGASTPVAGGEVEIWRIPVRRRRWTPNDEDLPRLRSHLEALLEEGEGGRTASLAHRGAAIVGGTLHLRRIHAARDLAALDRLEGSALADYLNARPRLRWLPLEEGAPEEVAAARLDEEGIYRGSWLEFDEAAGGRGWRYACVVRQSLGPVTVVLHDGLQAGRWFGRDEDPVLLTHHPLARSFERPEPGRAVFLDRIGDLPASSLHGGPQASALALHPPGGDDGLISPCGASGHDGRRNLAGVLSLRFGFQSGAVEAGARFYRVSVVPASDEGTPAGAPHPVIAPLTWLRMERRGGVDRVEEVRLGPDSAGSTEGLFRIPLPSEGPWDAGQPHLLLDTTDPRWSNPEVRYLLVVEIFDGAGCRLRPRGTPPTGLPGPEREASFHFHRQTGGSEAPASVPYGALAHLLWWDNRPVRARIEGLRYGGRLVSADRAGMVLSGAPPEEAVGATFRAWHPNRRFLRHHAIRFLSGLVPRGPEGEGAEEPVAAPGRPMEDSSKSGAARGRRSMAIPPRAGNAGAPPGPPSESPYQALSRLFDREAGDEGFEVRVVAVGRGTDGSDLSFPRDIDRLLVPVRARAGRGAA